MNKLSHNQNQTESRKNEQGQVFKFAKTNKRETEARQWLQTSYIPAKIWASELNVSERVVQMWTSGERAIPLDRVSEILIKSQEILAKQQESLNLWIAQALKDSFGGNNA